MATKVDTHIQAHLLAQVDDASMKIRKLSDQVIRLAQKAVEDIDRGYSVNACGILQSSARELDEAAAMRNAFATSARYAECNAEHIELASQGLGTFFTSGI